MGLRCLHFRRSSAALGPKSMQELSLEVTPVDSEAKREEVFASVGQEGENDRTSGHQAGWMASQPRARTCSQTKMYACNSYDYRNKTYVQTHVYVLYMHNDDQ